MTNAVIFSEREQGFSKVPATISVQIEKLRERGMIINDEDYAHYTLESINYYRLLHYFAVFLDDNGKYYKEGTTFECGMRFYDFDRRLRSEILILLEEIELAVRAAVSNYHATKYGSLGYLNEDSFDRRHNHKAFLNKIKRMLDKNSHLSFVRHYNNKHKGAFPLWVLMELFSFGMLVFFYQDMRASDKKDISLHYFKLDARNADNWLENLGNLRNHCAHYNRIYGNNLPGELRKAVGDSVSFFPREYEMGSTLFDYLIAIRIVHRRGNHQKEWGKAFVGDMIKLFDDYADIVNPADLGFPEDWVNFLL
ncbi:MAG: Abi family protein [Oscillospiraceae bacterium]|nr:Abi family protein [Oscillospiraceae bacterium]